MARKKDFLSISSVIRKRANLTTGVSRKQNTCTYVYQGGDSPFHLITDDIWLLKHIKGCRKGQKLQF